MRGRIQETRLLYTIIIILVCIIGVLLYGFVMDKPQPWNSSPDLKQVEQEPDPVSKGHPDDSQAAEKSRPIAKIGDKIVTYADLEHYIMTYYSSGLLKLLLDGIIIELEAEQIGVEVPERAIDEELLRMQQGYLTVEDFYATMEEQLGMSREQIRLEIYHRLLLERIAIHGIEIDDAEIKQYIEDHPEEFWSGTALHLQVLVTQTEEDAMYALKLLNEGMEFKELVIAYAMDGNDDVDYYGDLGWVQADDPFIPFELMETARRMNVGDISAPIQVEEGRYAILMLAGRKTMSLDERRRLEEQIRIELALSRAQPLPELLDQLRNKWEVTVIDPDFQF